MVNNVDAERVSAYAVYRNLVNARNKKVNKFQNKRKRNRKRRNASALQDFAIDSIQLQRKRTKKICLASRMKSNGKTSCNIIEGIAVTTPGINLAWIDSSSNKGINSSRNAVKKGNTTVKVRSDKRSLKKTGKIKTTLIKNNSPTKGRKRSKTTKVKASDTSQPHDVETSKMSEVPPPGMNDNYDSFSNGRKKFSWLIHPATPDDFFRTTWEKRPLHIKRHLKNYYSSLLSTEGIDSMLRKHNIIYGKNLDITSYADGKRETHNPVGRANASVVWDYYSNGCSVRLLNPQTFVDEVWQLCASLQDVFGCFVGANVYLTPPDSQGFAPHYDDIEAFILQLEGKKHWKLYAPLSSEECLPRFSSRNFSAEEIGEPILDVVLEAGDLLYFPRGVIHQGSTLPEAHSLHITVSSYQRNTWGDFLEKLIPVALKAAMDEDPSYREGLPRDYLHYMGVAHSDYTSEGRNLFFGKIGDLVRKLCDYAPVDATADQLGKQLMHDALPPALSSEEKRCTVFEDGERLAKGVVTNRVELNPNTRIKLLRGNVLRLVTEEDCVRAYHCIENSREYHGLEEPQFIELTAELAPAAEFLIHSYPTFVSVDELPLENLADKLQLAGDLWERGLVMTGEPLPTDED